MEGCRLGGSVREAHGFGFRDEGLRFKGQGLRFRVLGWLESVFKKLFWGIYGFRVQGFKDLRFSGLRFSA